MSDVRVYRRSELQAIDDGCLYRAHKIWDEGVDDTSDLAMIGIGFHAIKHRYILRLLQHGLVSDAEEARDAFTRGVVVARTPSRLLPELRGLWDFHTAGAKGFELPLDRFVAAEERQSSGQVTWAPDLVLAHPETNELEILDDKSGWAPAPTEDALRTLFQARVYSFYGMVRWPNFSRYRFTINAVRWGRSTSVVFSHEDLDNTERELAALIAVKEQAELDGYWPAVAGPACTYCDLICPIESPAQIPKRISSEEQFQALASYKLVAEAQKRGLDKVLKAYVLAHGPQIVNGIELANRPVLSRAYPIKPVVQGLSQIESAGGLDESDAMVSQALMTPLFKQFGKPLVDLLAPLVRETTAYRFSGRKVGSQEDGGDE